VIKLLESIVKYVALFVCQNVKTTYEAFSKVSAWKTLAFFF